MIDGVVTVGNVLRRASSWRRRFVWAGVELDETLNTANTFSWSSNLENCPGLLRSVEKAGCRGGSKDGIAQVGDAVPRSTSLVGN